MGRRTDSRTKTGEKIRTCIVRFVNFDKVFEKVTRIRERSKALSTLPGERAPPNRARGCCDKMKIHSFQFILLATLVFSFVIFERRLSEFTVSSSTLQEEVVVNEMPSPVTITIFGRPSTRIKSRPRSYTQSLLVGKTICYCNSLTGKKESNQGNRRGSPLEELYEQSRRPATWNTYGTWQKSTHPSSRLWNLLMFLCLRLIGSIRTIH